MSICINFILLFLELPYQDHTTKYYMTLSERLHKSTSVCTVNAAKHYHTHLRAPLPPQAFSAG